MFIPETNTTGGPATYAFAKENAICFSPFGIDNRGSITAKEYSRLANMMPIITQYQGTGNMFGIYKSGKDTTKGVTFILNKDITVTINYLEGYGGHRPVAAPTDGSPQAPSASYGLFVQTGENEFIVAGMNILVNASQISQQSDLAKRYLGRDLC